MVAAFGETAEVVQGFTSERSRLRRAVEGIRPSDQRSRPGAVWGLIEPHVAAEAGRLAVRVFSDLRLHEDAADATLPAGVDVRAVAVGTAVADNVGLVAAAARRDPERPERVSVFARLINAGPAAVRTNLMLTADGQVLRVEAVELPAATPGGAVGEASVTFEVAIAGAAELMLSHDHGDALRSDNTARLRLLAARRRRVLVVSAGAEPYLVQSLRAAGAGEVVSVSPEAYAAMSPAAVRDGAGVG